MSTVSQPKDILDYQIMTETTRGTFQAPGSPTAAKFVAQSPQLDYSGDLGLLMNDALGSRDYQAALDTVTTVRFAMMIPGIVGPETINFLKRGYNLEAGGDTIENLFSGCLRLKLGQTQYYLKLKAQMIGAGVLSLIGQGPWTATLWMEAKLDTYDTSAPTNWTFASVPTTTPLRSKDAGGVNHVTIRDVDAAQDYTPWVRALAVGFNNNVFEVPATGTDTWQDIIPTDRAINVRYITNVKDKTMFDIWRLKHEVNSTIVIKPTPTGYQITATGGKLSPYSIPFRNNAALGDQFTHVALHGSLSDIA